MRGDTPLPIAELIAQDHRADAQVPVRTADDRLRDANLGLDDSWCEDDEGGDDR